MTELIKIRSGKKFVFRNDHAFDSNVFWAWDIHDSAPVGRLKTHKWDRLPKGNVILFDIDNPPSSVGFIPILN